MKNEHKDADFSLACVSGRTMTTADILNATSTSEPCVKKILRRLVRDGEIVRVKHGVYVLPTQAKKEEAAFGENHRQVDSEIARLESEIERLTSALEAEKQSYQGTRDYWTRL